MSCSPFDLRDYALHELDDSQRRLAEQHLKMCAGCREELERLELTRSALLSLPDQEIPQRIAFVSDPVFEPSRARRAWETLWGSAAKLGFVSAAMLSVALVVSAFLMRPAPAPGPQAAAPQVDMAKLEARFSARLDQAVAQAVAGTEARAEQKVALAVAGVENRHTLEMKSIQLAVEQDFSLMQKRLNRFYLASNDYGARP